MSTTPPKGDVRGTDETRTTPPDDAPRAAPELPSFERTRLARAGLDELVRVRDLLATTLADVRSRTLRDDVASRRFLRGRVQLPEHEDVLMDALEVTIEEIRDRRTALADARRTARGDARTAAHELVIAEQRERALPLSRLTDVPRVDPDDPAASELSDEWRRLARFAELVSDPADILDVVREATEPGTPPPTRELLDALWRDGVVASPRRMPRSVGLDFGLARGEDPETRARKLVGQAPALAELFRSARGLRTPKGWRTTRVLVQPSGEVLVTRWQEQGNGAPRLVAKRFDDSFRAEREGQHLIGGTREEAERFFGYVLEFQGYRAELFRWNALAPEERLALGARIVRFYREVADALGDPQREGLAGCARRLRHASDELTKNPGALLAISAGLEDTFTRLEEVAESRAMTVSPDTRALHTLNEHFRGQRDRALARVLTLRDTVDLSSATASSVRATLTSVGEILRSRDDVDVLPAREVRAAVSAIVQRALAALTLPSGDARTRELRRSVLGLASVLKHSRLHTTVEQLRGRITLDVSTDEQALRSHAERVARTLAQELNSRASAAAQRRVGIPRDPANPLLPKTFAVDRAFRERVTDVQMLAAAHLEHAEPTVVDELARALDALGALAASRAVAAAVAEDLGI